MSEPNQTPEAPPEGSILPEAEIQEGAQAANADPAQARIQELEADLLKARNDILYAKAEVDNTVKRLQREAEERGKYAVTNFAREILQVGDNLRRALETLPKDQIASDELAKKLVDGIEMVEKGFAATLEKFGVKRIEALGNRFDPNLHQAMFEVEDPSIPAGTVVQEIQSGYVIQERLLRPAMVGVSKGGEKQPALDTTA